MESRIIDKEFISFNDQTVQNGLFIMAVNHIPPHIGWVCDNYYYSYSIRGVIIKLPLKDQIRKVELINIPSVVIELSTNISEEEAVARFENLGTLGYGDSCLRPINQLLRKEDGLMLFELIEAMDQEIIQVIDINANLSEPLKLPVYSKEIVNSNITKHLSLVENR